MKNVIIVIFVLAVVGAVGFFLFAADNTSNPATTTENNGQQTDDNQQEVAATFTVTEVETHASASDCWTIIDSNVYDITSYVPRHPGGDEILRACGTDGTTLFRTRTTEDGEKVGSGTPHSSNAQNQLSGFFIGTLANE